MKNILTFVFFSFLIASAASAEMVPAAPVGLGSLLFHAEIYGAKGDRLPTTPAPCKKPLMQQRLNMGFWY